MVEIEEEEGLIMIEDDESEEKADSLTKLKLTLVLKRLFTYFYFVKT